MTDHAYVEDLAASVLRRRLFTAAGVLAAVGGQVQAAVGAQSSWHSISNPDKSKVLGLVIAHELNVGAAGSIEWRDNTPTNVGLLAGTQELATYTDRGTFHAIGGSSLTILELYKGSWAAPTASSGTVRITNFSDNGSIIKPTGVRTWILKPGQALTVAHLTVNVALYSTWNWLEVPLPITRDDDAAVVRLLAAIAGGAPLVGPD